MLLVRPVDVKGDLDTISVLRPVNHQGEFWIRKGCGEVMELRGVQATVRYKPTGETSA